MVVDAAFLLSAPLDEPDLVVVPSGGIREALASRPHAILVEGRPALRSVGRRGWHTSHYVALPDNARPDVLAPMEQRGPLRHALAARMSRPGLRGVRNRLAGLALLSGAVPASRRLAVIERAGGRPFLIGAASTQLGIPEDVRWYMTPGQAGPLQRSAFHLFRPGQGSPTWVLKFNRVPGHGSRFDRDEQGRRAALAAGPSVTRHAPDFVGRLEVEGIHASVETSATGGRLSEFLASQAPQDEKIGRIRQIAEWLVATARETKSAPGTRRTQRDWLERDVLPDWEQVGGAGLLAATDAAPAVFRHGDVHPGNVFIDRDSFTLIDWEDAHLNGFPLWDLLPFLVDALAAVDGARDAERVEHMVRLCRGELDLSPELFRFIDSAVEAGEVPDQSVGALATLMWMSVAHSNVLHSMRASSHGGAPERPDQVLFAERWLEDPALGPEWPSRQVRPRA